jgi:two-component system, OmpR family, sensor histidine kinase KdpD
MSLRTHLRAADARTSRLERWVTPVTVVLAFIAATTIVLWLIKANLSQNHLIFVYLVPTAMIAIRYGSISAMGVTIVSSLVTAYFFYVPRYSFAVADRLEVIELVLFCLLALLASQVVSGFAGDRDVVSRRRGDLLQRLRRFFEPSR